MGVTTRGRTVGLATLTGVLALAIVLFSSSLAFGKGNSQPGPTPEGGVLRLDLGWHKNRFILQEQGAADQVQNIGVHRCAASLEGPADLVTLGAEPEGSQPSLAWSGLAVKQASYDWSCKVVSGAEVLTFGLSGALSEKLIEFGELDIEAKSGTTVLFEMLLDGSVVGETTFTASSAHGYRHRDNYRVIVEGSQPYDGLRMSVVSESGWFRWEAGTDGTPAGPLGESVGTKDSIFKLTDAQILGCGAEGGLSTGEEGPAATVIQPDGDGCQPIPVVFRSGSDEEEQFVSLEKNPEDTASFAMTVVWDPETPVMPVPATLIDFDDEAGPVPVEWCGTTSADWCLSSQLAELVEGQMVVTETYEGEGDPRWAR